MRHTINKEAFETLNKVEQMCRFATGSSNAWIYEGKQYFFEVDSYPASGVKGTIMRVSGTDEAVRVGEFEILANGVVRKGGFAFKDMADSTVMIQ